MRSSSLALVLAGSFWLLDGGAGPTATSELASGEGAAVSAVIGPHGATLLLGDVRGSLALASVGRTRRASAVPEATALERTHEGVVLHRGEVDEWWRSEPTGLEHGVTLDARPPGEGPLVLVLALDGALHARDAAPGLVLLTDAADTTLARYDHLAVVDARGRSLPSAMRASSRSIRIEIDDADAAYPIVVDPLVTAEEAILTAPTTVGPVAISGDGLRAIVGTQLDDPPAGMDAGSVSIFVRTGTSWALEQRITGAWPMGRFGSSVALSTDGSRAAVGGNLEGVAGRGMVHVLVRSGSTWTEEASFVAPFGSSYGNGIALSGDAIWAATTDSARQMGVGVVVGAVYFFQRTGTTWTQVSSYVGTTASTGLGASISITDDGSRVVVGEPAVDSALVLHRATTSFTMEATLRPTTTGTGTFGQTVAITGDGTRALVGYGGDAGNTGSARVFLRSGTSWSEEATLAPVATGLGFGSSVALSADGARAAVGQVSDNTRGASAGGVHLYVRSGSTWSYGAPFYASGAAAGQQFGRSVDLADDGRRGLGGLASTGRVFTVLLTNGSTCTVAGDCSSGNCVDGVCCASACGGGAADCQACSTSAGGSTNGTCTPLVAAATTQCRAAAGPCDPADSCSASSLTCPTNVVASAGTTCRASMGDCDPAEVCDGTSAVCPADLHPAGVVCRAAAGDCDVEESCDGTSVACPTDQRLAVGTSCRASRGPCDPAEACDGASTACPADVLSPSGTNCGGMGSGSCVMPATCDGATPDCGAGTPLPAGTLCAPRDASLECDADDFCDASGHCVPTYAPATTSCGAAPSGACDAPDHCAGTSAGCVEVFATAVMCRAAAGTCDVAEFCPGTSAVCPPDGVLAAGIACRPSTSSCDPAETCDGTLAACPSDLACPGTDAGTSGDAGHDAGASDAASGNDAATIAPPAAAGCACRATPATRMPSLLYGLVALVTLTRRRRLPTDAPRARASRRT